jgi:hypothetical protein
MATRCVPRRNDVFTQLIRRVEAGRLMMHLQKRRCDTVKGRVSQAKGKEAQASRGVLMVG